MPQSKASHKVPKKVRKTRTQKNKPTKLQRSYNDNKVVKVIHLLPVWVQLSFAVLLIGLIGYIVINDQGSSEAAIIFSGNYESGNLSQWGNCQFKNYNNDCSAAPSTYSVRAQSAVKREGNYAGRFELRDGDYAIGANERTEVQASTARIGGTEGSEMWYSQSILFDQNFPSSHSWGLVSQFKGNGGSSPPMGLYVDHGTNLWGLSINNYSNSSSFSVNKVWSTSLNKGTWHDIKLHVKWSANDSVGYVEIWHNGVQQTFKGACAGKTRCIMSNMVPGSGSNYYKQGYYRCACVSGTGVVYHDNFKAGRSEADLGTSTSPPTPAPAPQPTPNPIPTPTPPVSPTPTPTDPGNGVLKPNDWESWVPAGVYGTRQPVTRSQTNGLLMQFDGQKRGYYSTQWAHYCLYIPSGVNIPKTFTFSASYNPNNYNRVYAYAGSSTPKLWAVENTNGRLTTSTHTISLNGQRKVCVGNEIKSNYGGYFPVARYLKINNYNFKY